MRRDKEINSAASKYIEDNSMTDGYVSISNHKDSFIEGAKWTDENLRTPWTNANDSLPNDETKLYIIYCEAYNKNGDDIKNKHHEIYLANFDKETSSWLNVESYNNYFFDVLYWMEVPEIPKDVCEVISELNNKHLND